MLTLCWWNICLQEILEGFGLYLDKIWWLDYWCKFAENGSFYHQVPLLLVEKQNPLLAGEIGGIFT
jgi:hypothetical protein